MTTTMTTTAMVATTIARRPDRWASLALLAVAALLSGCGRGLLGISSAENRDASLAEVDPNPVPAGKSVCFPDHPASCDDTCRAATSVLWHNCARCHGDPSTAYGLPPWGFVMDPQQLVTQSWSQGGGTPPIRFVLPGDPEHSAIYQRAVIRKDMPPVQRDPAESYYPRVGESDGQILHDWIARCLGADPVDAGSPLSPDVRGDAIVPGDAGPVSCPSSPSSGACAIEHQYCLYPTQSCLCTGGNWACLACPGQQPTIGSSCAPQPGREELLTFQCGYGSVSCSCDRRNVDNPIWGCGVCPASRPTGGAACGNASFSCAYGNDTCLCTASGWSCVLGGVCPSLSSGAGFDTQWVSCWGTKGCDYPGLGQSCACAPSGHWDCACPLALPTEGSACVSPLGFTRPCAYSDQSCNCTLSDGWHCTSACPTSRPGAGDACSSALSCTYDGALCYCDGTRWQCS